MCTFALYFQTFGHYPLVVAANRDEHFDRPSSAPALLDGHPKILAGLDLRAGGTWLGVNEFGLFAGVLNRHGNGSNDTALPASAARSRGLLCMELLRAQSVPRALNIIKHDDARYNPFTLVFGDQDAAYAAYNDTANIIVQPLKPGLHVFSSAAEFDLNSAKAARAHQRFAQLIHSPGPHNEPPTEWLPSLQHILGDHSLADGSEDPGDAICVHRQASGTVSSSVIFLAQSKRCFSTFHCTGAPCQNDFGPALNLRLQ